MIYWGEAVDYFAVEIPESSGRIGDSQTYIGYVKNNEIVIQE